MPATRPSNLGPLIDTGASATVASSGDAMTSGASTANVRFPWQSRLSNDLPLADTARPSNSSPMQDTTVRLSNDAPLSR